MVYDIHKKVLIYTDVNFWEACSGHRVRIAALIRYLSTHFCLTVVNTGPAEHTVDSTVTDEFGIEFIVLEHEEYLDSNAYGEKLKSFLECRHFDTIIIEYIHSSYCLNFLPYDCHVILDTHDIISERTEQFRKFNYCHRLQEMQEKDEGNIFNIYDHVMMISRPDFEKASLLVGREKVLLCPHPCETHDHEFRLNVKKIAFVASCYLPNVDSINHFVRYCWDDIRSEFNVDLYVYGTVCTELDFSERKGIHLRGFEKSLNRIYEEADIIINPVRFGAGLKIKNLEALAHGRPLVTTRHGARGLEAGASQAFQIADDDSAFVSAVRRLIVDAGLRKTMQKNAHQFIRKNFSPTKCFKPLYDAINVFDIQE